MGLIQPKHTHELGELTHQTDNTVHTKGNLVNTSHPGCERNVAMEAEKSDPGPNDLCDYCSVVTLSLQGDRIATTWRLYKLWCSSYTHLKFDSAVFQVVQK